MRTFYLSTLFVSSLIVSVTTGAAATATADQEALLKVKALYASAAYEEALAVIAGVPNDTGVTELDQYRVFCLIALGQQQDAHAVLQKLLTQNPLYEPSAADTPPRVLEEFRNVRRELVPEIARQLYADAKAALERKEREPAIDGFEKVVKIAALDGIGDPMLADLQVLANGFLDLSRLLPEPVAERAEATPPPPSDSAKPEATPAPVFTRPVALDQTMPPWNAPDWATRRTEFRGSIRVLVGADGTVTSAAIERSIHPIYDRALLEAAKQWKYEPARRGGQPVAAEVVVQVQLRPDA